MSYTHYAIQNAIGTVVRHWHPGADPDCRYCDQGVPLDERPGIDSDVEEQLPRRITLSKWVDD